MNIFDNELFFGHEDKELKRYDDPIDTLPKMVSYSELPKLSLNGTLIANYHVNGELKQIYSKSNTHSLIIAATGAGKTTSYAIPTIVSYARQKVKRSLVISDPKGEVYRATAATLKEEGYKVYVISFRDPSHSEFWNPLTPIFRAFKAARAVYDEVKVIETENGYRNEFRGKIYENQAELDRDVELFYEIGMSTVGNMIDDMAGMMITVESAKDKTWEYGAMDLLRAFLWGMLEDSVGEPPDGFGKITEDNFSLRTIFSILMSFKPMNDDFDNGYFESRRPDSKAFQLSRSTMDCAKNTRSSYTSTFLAKLVAYRNATIQTITSCNSFELSELTGERVAVFINYQDEIKTQYHLISLFVQSAYNYLIDYANKRPDGKLDTPFCFILDEFGNFPRITDFDTAITAARGRNIFFSCILQSYAQLDNVYDRQIAEIIRDNLNVKIFLGSNNPSTIATFQQECGEHTIISPLSALNGQGTELTSYSFETLPLIPKSDLAYFLPGECVVTELNKPYVLWSKLERYFECPELAELPKADLSEYKSEINPYDKKYVYLIPTGKKNNDDFDF